MTFDWKLLALYAAFGSLGYFAHVLKTMRQVNWQKSIYHYIREYPNQTAAAFIGFIVAFAGLYEMGQLNMSAAFACGYMANSAADTIAGRSMKILK